MTTESLLLFRDIVQTRSLSRAARLHGLSPSAVSQHLQELERQLDAELLDRSTRPVSVTPAGRLYHELCRDVLRRHEQFLDELAESRGEASGTVRLAAIYSVGLSEMSMLEADFLRRLPGARLQVTYLRPERVYDAVTDDQADLGLVSYPTPTREVAVRPWRQERMVVAMHPDHRLAGRRAVQPADLQDQEFIAFDEDLPIRREVDRYLREHGAEVRIVMHFDNLQMIKEAVALGSGVSIIPDRIVQAEVAQGRIATVPLAAPGLFRPVGIIHRKRQRLSRAAQELLALLEVTEPAEKGLPLSNAVRV